MVIKNIKITKILIAAISQNGIIGNKGKLPWNSKLELKHFKKTTIGSPVIFGRKTFESIGKPLKTRVNIVISKTIIESEIKQNVLVFSSLKEAYQYLTLKHYKKVYVAGGEAIFKLAMRDLDEMIISWMKFSVEGDTKFPKIISKNWDIVKKAKYDEFEVFYYKRKLKQ